jgi:hypothetical protein
VAYLKSEDGSVITVIGLAGCSRCGGTHREPIEFHRLEQPVPDPEGPFTHWGRCPTNGEPILTREQ